jgi:short-subunit dehydrogenase
MDITSGTTAFITGANGGLGQAIARTLAKAGATIVVSGRRADALQPIADELGARVIVADLSKRDEVDRAIAEAGAVDVLVANAALPCTGHLLEFNDEQLDRALDVNLRTPIFMARKLGEGMAQRGRGSIVFISSISGKVAAGGSSMYSATKFALRGFSLALRDDMRASGVGVTTVFPGFIRDAGMFAATGVQLPKGTGTRSPEDVANAVLRAVRKNPAEINVAAFEQSLAGFLAGVSPGFVSALARALGGEKVAKQIGAAQAHKR